MKRFCRRSSYLAAAALALPTSDKNMVDTSLVTNKARMNEYYRQDIRRDTPLNSLIPIQWPGAAQNGCQSIRVVSWNINVMCGIASTNWVTRDGEAVAPAAVLEVIRSLNADVLVLQEAMQEPDQSEHDDPYLPRACERVRALDELLLGLGYELYRSRGQGHGNHVLLATRIPAHPSSVELDVGDWHERVCGAGEKEQHARVAVSAGLKLAGDLRLGVYGVHLLHRSDLIGARAAEVRRLLAHADIDPDACHLVLGDFNQVRHIDLTDDEKRVVAYTAKRFKNAEDDGVASLLREANFVSCWDMPGRRNFSEPSGAGVLVPVAPPYTHWTGTTLDHGYLRSGKNTSVSLGGAYIFYTELSDHLPVVLDVIVQNSQRSLL